MHMRATIRMYFDQEQGQLTMPKWCNATNLLLQKVLIEPSSERSAKYSRIREKIVMISVTSTF